jgi:hypothetical protein
LPSSLRGWCWLLGWTVFESVEEASLDLSCYQSLDGLITWNDGEEVWFCYINWWLISLPSLALTKLKFWMGPWKMLIFSWWARKNNIDNSDAESDNSARERLTIRTGEVPQLSSSVPRRSVLIPAVSSNAEPMVNSVNGTLQRDPWPCGDRMKMYFGSYQLLRSQFCLKGFCPSYRFAFIVRGTRMLLM